MVAKDVWTLFVLKSGGSLAGPNAIDASSLNAERRHANLSVDGREHDERLPVRVPRGAEFECEGVGVLLPTYPQLGPGILPPELVVEEEPHFLHEPSSLERVDHGTGTHAIDSSSSNSSSSNVSSSSSSASASSTISCARLAPSTASMFTSSSSSMSLLCLTSALTISVILAWSSSISCCFFMGFSTTAKMARSGTR